MTKQIEHHKVIGHADSVALGINLRHLRAFSAVAAAGSVAAAADALYRVASAVTRSVLDLEAALGRPLFDRRARGMALNAYGELVLVRALRIEREFEEARTQLVARGGMDGGADVHSLFTSILNGRRLAVVASLAQKRNMPAVAREFGITQPAISSALKDLESGLGVALFTRTARGLSPTPAGEIVAFYFKRVLSELRHIGPDIAASEGSLQGSVTVGALPLGRTQILPLAIASLLARHPQLHVSTVESPYDALAASLRSGDIDFILGALRNNAGEVKDLQQQALFEDRISVIARAGHPLARAERIDFRMLREARWTLSRQGSPSRELLERFFSNARQAPPLPAVETGDLAVLRGLLLESDMLTAISAHQLRYEIRDGSLVVLDFPLEETRREIGLTQRLGAFPSPGARALMEEIGKVVAGSADFR
ncbi:MULTISPECIES: LysR family transcriptional regulator [Variovorax]|jgi:LysR family transcriptional regulator, regulator for genes of the gallate degradation pathway|uniref:LysR family transcriptional regulator n=1 Tax=Variovorax TaxID=34072 RepID=UPI00086AC21D|nr:MULTISPECIES: LysR family transcriptional regulator [Variovorax]MBN8758267.1 LysR family transcriptional regulator [Variovorax sp.]ODU11393.1 MAG: LysR family transcriptional regulator [Variovorax sp. SCN 67-85]OJZ11854.1 MAG: LysR family transcriptional regulator [Variovorax sp. 67-131]UKI05558.1 LysR family transcriptional regulator [Variovorax paradoxus]